MIQNLMTTAPTARQQLDFRLAATVSNLLVMVNSSCNFVLYSSLSTKFRRTFRQLCCTRCYRPTTAKRAGGGGGGGDFTAAAPAVTQSRSRTRNEYRLIGCQQTTL